MIKPAEFIHPEDAAALRQLESIPGFPDPHNDNALASKEALEYWNPVDWYNGGMEHTTLEPQYPYYPDRRSFEKHSHKSDKKHRKAVCANGVPNPPQMPCPQAPQTFSACR